MLLPKFELHQPTTVDEAVALAKEFAGDFDYLAGGTDLLPNYKCGLNAHGHVISLAHIDELHHVDATTIGAATTLTELEKNSDVPAVVAYAAGKIASPLLRESGTLGGNLMLDNRCHFFNQSYFWRRTLGYCLKADGDRCHVVPRINVDGENVLNTTTCVATHSSDLAPVLIALGAEAHFNGPNGARTTTLNDFYYGDGIARHRRNEGEMLVKITLPDSAKTTRAGYRKLAPRRSVDFPVLGVAVAMDLGSENVVESMRVVLGAIDTTPVLYDFSGKETKDAPPSYLFIDPTKDMPEVIGKALDDELIATIAGHVQTTSQPKLNVPMEPGYRKKMAGVLTRRLITELRDNP